MSHKLKRNNFDACFMLIFESETLCKDLERIIKNNDSDRKIKSYILRFLEDEFIGATKNGTVRAFIKNGEPVVNIFFKVKDQTYKYSLRGNRVVRAFRDVYSVKSHEQQLSLFS